jgi:hypothetical protein
MDARNTCGFIVAFIQYKLARTSQMPEMRAQTFHARYERFDRFNFEASCDFHYSTGMKLVRAHPRHLTNASQLALCKCCLKDSLAK